MSRILVVDDEPDVRTALTMLLEEEGHSVIELDDGKDVMDFITTQGVDLIMLDLSMPDTDGFQVLDAMRNDSNVSSVPVIVVSARGRPDDKALAKSLGAMDYVNKPWSEGEVEFRVGMALGSIERKWVKENKRDISHDATTEADRRLAAGSTSLTVRKIAPPVSNIGVTVLGAAPARMAAPSRRRRPARRVIRRGRRRAA
ncbi:MAG: response regulator [Chloroflexi bacterium]|nr:response regulator [Chloroflexota bacterium]